MNLVWPMDPPVPRAPDDLHTTTSKFSGVLNLQWQMDPLVIALAFAISEILTTAFFSDEHMLWPMDPWVPEQSFLAYHCTKLG